MVRLWLILPRALKNLEEVKTMYSHFEQYGRLKEFSINRDFFTKQRERSLSITFADETVAKTLLKKETETVSFPTSAVPPTTSNTSTTTPTTETRKDVMMITIRRSREQLPETIKRRAGKLLRTNDATQARINKAMLKGFEGYHGELGMLWESLAKSSVERSVRMMAQDRLWDERRRENIERRKKREHRVLESGKITGEGMEDEGNGVRDRAEAERVAGSNGIEEQLEEASQAVINLRLELGGEGISKKAEKQGV